MGCHISKEGRQVGQDVRPDLFLRVSLAFMSRWVVTYHVLRIIFLNGTFS